MKKEKIQMTTAGGGGFPRLARVMTCLMLMLTGLGTGVKAADVDLSTLAADYTAQNGDVLTGTLSQNVKITVADGATVTLKDAVINGTNNDSWAGLNLAGDGTIILKGENTVKGFYEDYPGIFVPEGKTLTIQGDGTLNASSNGFGAGIGGGLSINCGNIAIEGGTITATGGEYAAGIGGGVDAACGNILITGGTITATGGASAAGIGCGYRATVGNITITDGVTKVTATKGEDAPNSIGAGYDGSCGTVTIGGNVTGNVTDSPYTYTGTGGSAPAAEGFTAALAEGTEDAGNWTLKVGDGSAQALPVEGLSEGQTLTLTYTGNRRVRSVKAIVVPAEAPAPAAWDGDLSKLTADATAEFATATNGMTITGTLPDGVNVKITIADGATVTLKDTNINGSGTLTDGDYAGLTPEGDAIIILEGSNTVKGFKENYPGIFAAVGKTLTIQGTGSLNTSGNGCAAGIGSCGWGSNCGNIVIAGGTVTAVGGQYAAGIGSGPWTSCGTITITGGTVNATGGGTSMDGTGIGAGNGGGTAGTDQSSCGDISITGGTVTATGNGNGAGIGGSWNSKCGTITIGSGVTSVTATKGSSCPNSIGAGTSGSCGTVTIGGTEGAISTSPYTYQP